MRLRSSQFILLFILIFTLIQSSCNNKLNHENMNRDQNIIFLHHSTGEAIWNGNSRNLNFLFGKIQKKFNRRTNRQAKMLRLFRNYNSKNGTGYSIKELVFPKTEPYGWNNYPYDYYNIWVKNGGDKHFMDEPTLEILTKKYQVIIFKHCFPVGLIEPDQDTSNIDSDYKSLANYKLQYLALRDKLNQFDSCKFILWTGAALVKNQTNEEQAKRTKEFFDWVKKEWDRPGDNIYLWDFYDLETEGNLYMKEEYAVSVDDSHPNNDFSDRSADLLFDRIIDVIENNGSKTWLTGQKK